MAGKELTREEALEKAKQEVSHQWLNSSPLIGAFPAGGKLQLFPLDPIFQKQGWLIFFKDPTHPSAPHEWKILHEFHKRYSDYGFNIILVLDPHYSLVREKEFTEALVRKNGLTFPIVIDTNRALAQCFGLAVTGSAERPTHSVVHFPNEKTVSHKGVGWSEPLEKVIQTYLRNKDPGLPLPPIFEPATLPGVEIDRTDFFRGAAEPVPELHFEYAGIWYQEGDRLVTADTHATLSFQCPSSHFTLVARALARSSNVARVQVEVNGAPVPVGFADRDLQADDDGGLRIRLEEPRPYSVLQNLPSNLRKITLRFPNADRAAVGIYGVSYWRTEKKT